MRECGKGLENEGERVKVCGNRDSFEFLATLTVYENYLT
jgi:hypothetical protein